MWGKDQSSAINWAAMFQFIDLSMKYLWYQILEAEYPKDEPFLDDGGENAKDEPSLDDGGDNSIDKEAEAMFGPIEDL